jgi:hypothetical protein
MTQLSEPTDDTDEAADKAVGTVAGEAVAGQINTGPAAERATYDQLGSQLVSDVSSPYLDTMIKSWLEIPRYMKIYDRAGIGHPAVTPPVSYRRPLEEILHRERYEPTKVRDQTALEAFLWDHSALGGLRSTGGLKGIKPSTDSLLTGTGPTTAYTPLE